MSLPAPPLRRDGPTLFADRGDAFMAALPAFEARMEAIDANVVTREAVAVSSAAVAAASAQSAMSYSTAPVWSAATSYAVGAPVHSPVNQRVYRRKISGVSPSDPSADSVNWGITEVGPVVVPVNSLAYSAVAGCHYVILAGGTVEITLPPNTVVGDEVWVTVCNGRYSNNIKCNGKLLMGLIEDMRIDTAFGSVRLRYLNNDWRIL